MSLLLLIAVIVPAFLDPTNIFPESLSAICLGVSMLSTNISTEKPFSIFKFSISSVSYTHLRAHETASRDGLQILHGAPTGT